MTTDSEHNWRERIRHAFSVDDVAAALTDADRDLIERLSQFIVDRGLREPATAALEASRPYTFLGSQFLLFMKPFAHIALPGPDYDRFTRLIENRTSIDVILDEIEKADSGV